MFETPDGAARRTYNTTAWGLIVSVDDSQKMQRVDIRGINGEMFHGVERPQTYGHTSVPLPSEGGKGAEVVIGFRAGNRAHTFVQATDDRRYRMKNLKGGESAHHDDQGQYSHLARDGHVAVAKTHSITAGDKPDTGGGELNDQTKGLEARIAHLEHSHAGLFDVVSQFRQIVQGQIPAVAAVAPILNQDPTGLTKMTQAVQGKFPAYLQTHIQDAVGKFLSPTITGVGSVMGGADGIIAALQSQIAGVIAANPIVAAVDDLLAELAALTGSASPSVVAATAPIIQGLIDSATAANPVVAQVADLRSKLDGLVTAAGPALSFLGPQQRIPQRLSKSLKLSP